MYLFFLTIEPQRFLEEEVFQKAKHQSIDVSDEAYAHHLLHDLATLPFENPLRYGVIM